MQQKYTYLLYFTIRVAQNHHVAWWLKRAILTHTEYNRLIVILNQLIDEVGSNESQPLATLMDVGGALIEPYDDQHTGMMF